MNPNNVFTLDPSFQMLDPERLQRMQSKRYYEGDNDYTQYQLPPFIQAERIFLYGEKNDAKDMERAFTIANKATTAIELGHLKDTQNMSLHAIQLDSFCVDGWRNYCKVLSQICDCDTIICATREVLHFARKYCYKPQFEENNGMFYTMPITRPYIRILQDIARASLQNKQLDVSIFAYEEILRLNHNDNNSVRDDLLACYIKIIGRIKRFPDTKPVRTVKQAEELINAKLSSDNLFEENNLTVRWARICIAFLENKNWIELAKIEFEKNEIVFQIIFNEVEISQIPPSNPLIPQRCAPGSKNDEARLKGPRIKEALNDWPEFVIELRRLIRGSVTDQMMKDIFSAAPNTENELVKERKDQILTIDDQILKKGRDYLSDRNFEDAIKIFTLAKRKYFEASLPSRRCYINTPFNVFSNRATAAYQLQMWNLLRIDIRYTLFINPNHDKTYLRLVELAEAFKANQLIEEFKEIEEKAQGMQIKSDEEWKELAKTVIGLTSIAAFAFAAKGLLTQEKKDELIEIGIEDFYSIVNVGGEYQTLPWLSIDDIEQKV